MYPMRLKAGDIQSRVRISRLILKMDDQPDLCRELGLEDVSALKDEDKDNAALACAMESEDAGAALRKDISEDKEGVIILC